MKTQQHTPGPWYYTCGAVWKDPDAETYCIAKMDRDTPHTRPTERDANARLIAAAPDLLEALRYLLFAGRDGAVFYRDYAHKKARDAIAKATK